MTPNPRFVGQMSQTWFQQKLKPVVTGEVLPSRPLRPCEHSWASSFNRTVRSVFTADPRKASRHLPALLPAHRVQKGPAPLARGAGTRTAHSAHYFLTASILTSLAPAPPAVAAVPAPPARGEAALSLQILLDA